MVRKLVMWGLILCLKHSISIISHMLRFAMTRWDNFDSYTWTLVLLKLRENSAPAAPISVQDQCLAYLRNLKGPGHFTNTYSYDSGKIVPTMCVWIMSTVEFRCNDSSWLWAIIPEPWYLSYTIVQIVGWLVVFYTQRRRKNQSVDYCDLWKKII